MDKKTVKINFIDTEKGYFNNNDNLFLDMGLLPTTFWRRLKRKSKKNTLGTEYY